MTTDLEAFRDHARRMSTAHHKPGCRFHDAGLDGHVCTDDCTHPNQCHGCVTDADRSLWGRLADETDTYLTQPEEAGLFT